MYHLQKVLRKSVMQNPALLLSQRGGGGFHKPEPKLEPEYVHRRILKTTELGEQLFHDKYPEFYMHMHAHYMESGAKTWAFMGGYFLLIIAPIWAFMMYMMRYIRGQLHPAVSPGKDN